MDVVSIINQINSDENKQRKAISFQQNEIYSGRLKQYVIDYIASRYDAKSLQNMPVISSINLSNRIINKSASLYTKKPKRYFKNCSSQVQEVLEQIYKDMNIDSQMVIANRNYKKQDQTILQVIPYNGKLTLRNFNNHNIDAIENPENPNEAIGYITSSFDRTSYQKSYNMGNGQISDKYNYSDGMNQKIGDKDDWKIKNKRYVFWTNELNFITDGRGELVQNDNNGINILGTLPFIDIATGKDYEFWTRSCGDLFDFTIQLNCALSSLWQIIDLQGFSIAYLIADEEVMPESMIVGPSKVLRLKYSKETNNKPEFGFTSPNPDLAGSREFIDLLLSLFLTTKGIDTKSINTKGENQQYASGLDRLLAKIESFESSQEDMELFRKAEIELFEKVKIIVNNLNNTNLLDAKYSIKIPQDAELEIEFAKPEILKTDSDLIDEWIKKLEAGLASKRDAIKDLYKIDGEDLELKLKEIALDNFEGVVMESDVK